MISEETQTEVVLESFPCVGTVGRGLFAADFSGPEGLGVLFTGAIRVHRTGLIKGEDRKFFFECYGKNWAGGYLGDPASARWFDHLGNPAQPVLNSQGVALSTEDDYWNVILPVFEMLEKKISAEANPKDLEKVYVGCRQFWQYKKQGEFDYLEKGVGV